MVDDKEDLKEKYMEYQLLIQQLQQLQENASALEKHTVSLHSLNGSLDSMSETKIGQETLIPLGAGVFIRGNLKDNSKVVMNVGANICIEKNIDEAKETVSKQLNEINEFFVHVQDEIARTTIRLQKLQEEFESRRIKELG